MNAREGPSQPYRHLHRLPGPWPAREVGGRPVDCGRRAEPSGGIVVLCVCFGLEIRVVDV